ncbi:flagellin N-terminal helical domain-containing protein [Actinotalea caeni]|uniref:flagellin N-terminal helical domain-containing protein n=1 Tax=Actinotalea caeni TaxID=1348467 RepID=UPI0012E214F2|nr:flagellin [Actinotalea caeni]
MGFAINTNLPANNTYRQLSITQDQQAKSLEKLSSGLRINRAGDDAAGLSIAEGLKSQVNGYTVAARNAQDGISVVQTAEGALGEVQSILQRMRDLAVQGANDTNNAESRAAIKAEADQLGNELWRIAESTNFNGISLLKGGDALNIQVGADGNAAAGGHNTISVNLGDVATAVGALASTDGADGAADFDVTDADTAAATIEAIDTALVAVSEQRSDLGAVQNRLEYAVKNINVSIENLTASESRIRDVDMASEMVKFTRSQVLSQAGTAMLAQANQAGQGVLQLLR